MGCYRVGANSYMLILPTVFICGVAAVYFWGFFMGVVTADGVGCDKGASARYRGMVAGYTGADYCGHVLFLYHITMFHVDRQVRRPRVVVRSMCSLHCVITTTAHLRSTALHGRCTTADWLRAQLTLQQMGVVRRWL